MHNQRDMQVMTEYMKHMFYRLLVDIRVNSGCLLDTPGEISDGWLLKEAPALDKAVMLYVENGQQWPVFPDWVRTLSDLVKGHIDIEKESGVPSNTGARLLSHLHQLLVFCYKAELPYEQHQVNEAQAKFLSANEGCYIWGNSNITSKYCLFSVAKALVGRIIYRLNWSDINPSHGPGAVYPPCPHWERSRFSSVNSVLASKYPLDLYFFPLESQWLDRGRGLPTLPGELKRVAKHAYTRPDPVITSLLTVVPKDSRGPRLISVHPKEAIWIQQGQRRLLEDAITNNPMTRGKISFHDQTVNGSLALKASKTREFVTLDLSEASDSVSQSLVRYLFGDYAYDWISCSRASHVKLLDGDVVPLHIWAPMGNALCFPVESLVFWSLVVAGIRSHYGENCSEVYVFGDDIVFPSEYYAGVLTALVAAGLKPNVSKTYRTGFFRESCGVEAYGGHDITPLRLKKALLPTLEGIQASLDLAKRARLRGYESLASYIYTECRKRLGYLPLVNNPDTSGFVEFVRKDLGQILLLEPKARFHSSTQQWVVPHKSLKPILYRPKVHDWNHVVDSLTRIAQRDSYSDRKFEYTRPYRMRLTYGWTPILVNPE